MEIVENLAQWQADWAAWARGPMSGPSGALPRPPTGYFLAAPPSLAPRRLGRGGAGGRLDHKVHLQNAFP
jgi:hypothetical protein